MNRNQILIELSESDRTKLGKEHFVAQSIPQQVFSSVWTVEGEVNNGGFSQYFLNGAESVPFVAEALDLIGAPRTAEICRCAIKIAFPDGLASNPEGVSSEAAALSEEVLRELDELDSEFIAYPHDLTLLLFNYVSAHPDEFGKLSPPD